MMMLKVALTIFALTFFGMFFCMGNAPLTRNSRWADAAGWLAGALTIEMVVFAIGGIWLAMP